MAKDLLQRLHDAVDEEDRRTSHHLAVLCKHCGRPKREHTYVGDGDYSGAWICPDKVFEPIQS